MAPIKFKVIAHGGPAYKAAVVFREAILRKPWGRVYLPEELEKEKEDVQIAGFQGEEIVATAILTPEGKQCKMQRVAVKESLQRQGVGSQMMAFCEEQAQAQGFEAIYCHAIHTAVEFYIKHHYIPEGDYFDEHAVPHLKMRKEVR